MARLGAGWFPELFRIRVFGPVNLVLLFALSEFVAAWGVAFVYARRAGAEFDALAAEVQRAALSGSLP